MNAEKYSERVRGFIQSAQTMALSKGHQQFSPEHMLKVLVDDEEGFANSLIERAGGRPKDVKFGVEAALNAMPKVEGGNGQLYLAQPLAKVFSTAEEIAKKAGDSFVTVERLLTALAVEKSAKTADTARYGRFFHAMLAEGVYLAPSQFEAAFTSAAHDDLVLGQVTAALARIRP